MWSLRADAAVGNGRCGTVLSRRRRPSTVMKKNEFALVIGYLTALTALFWLAYLIGTHVGHIHVA